MIDSILFIRMRYARDVADELLLCVALFVVRRFPYVGLLCVGGLVVCCYAMFSDSL